MKSIDQRPLRETTFCNEQMFECISNGLCIIQHYVCDGKPDCKDGSDESVEKCSDNPCKEKIPCDDGRCIPTAWCCDRNHDLNCTVTNRPKCCQSLSDCKQLYSIVDILTAMLIFSAYEELENGISSISNINQRISNINQSSHNGARYLFISVCKRLVLCL